MKRYRKHLTHSNESGIEIIVTEVDLTIADNYIETHTAEEVAQHLAELHAIMVHLGDEFCRIQAFLESRKLGEAYDEFAKGFKVIRGLNGFDGPPNIH